MAARSVSGRTDQEHSLSDFNLPFSSRAHKPPVLPAMLRQGSLATRNSGLRRKSGHVPHQLVDGFGVAESIRKYVLLGRLRELRRAVVHRLQRCRGSCGIGAPRMLRDCGVIKLSGPEVEIVSTLFQRRKILFMLLRKRAPQSNTKSNLTSAHESFSTNDDANKRPCRTSSRQCAQNRFQRQS